MKNYYFISSFEENLKSLDSLETFLLNNHQANSYCVFVPSSLIEYPQAFSFEESLIQKLKTYGISFRKVHRLNSFTSKKEAQKLIKKASFIYLHGGNPLVLYETLKYFGIRELLLKKSCSIMGLSAGAMVMGEHIVLTPTSLEYPDFVIQKALQLGPFNIMPHINCETIYWPIVPTGDGPIQMKDLQKQSETITIHALRDYQHLTKIGKKHYVNAYPLLLFHQNEAFLLGKDGLNPLYSFQLLDQQVRQLAGFTTSWITKPEEPLTQVYRYYDTFEEALKYGFLKRLAGITVDQRQVYPCEFRLLGFFEKSLVILQSNFDDTMVFLLFSPQLKVGSISYYFDKNLQQVVEHFSFRSRFGKFADEYKIKGMML